MKLRRRFIVLLTLLVAIGGVLAFPSTRLPLLRATGQVLIATDSPIDHADIVVVSIDAGTAGILEAADLIHNGVADRVAAFVSPLGNVDLELRSRGVLFRDIGVEYRQQLGALGVKYFVSTPRVDGTEEQGRVFPIWCDEHGFTSVIVVTSWHHSRRVRRVLERAMKGRPTVVAVRVVNYSDFSPDNWWQNRAGARTVTVELQKLVVDFARHPFS